MPVWKRNGKLISVSPHHAEGPFGPSETRTAGAMTMKQQIDRIRAAGIVQGAWRRAHFPPDEAVPDDFVPPEYNPTEMDLIDEAKRVLNGKAANAAQARKQKAEEHSYGKVPPEPAPEEPDPEPTE